MIEYAAEIMNCFVHMWKGVINNKGLFLDILK